MYEPKLLAFSDWKTYFFNLPIVSVLGCHEIAAKFIRSICLASPTQDLVRWRLAQRSMGYTPRHGSHAAAPIAMSVAGRKYL